MVKGKMVKLLYKFTTKTKKDFLLCDIETESVPYISWINDWNGLNCRSREDSLFREFFCPNERVNLRRIRFSSCECIQLSYSLYIFFEQLDHTRITVIRGRCELFFMETSEISGSDKVTRRFSPQEGMLSCSMNFCFAKLLRNRTRGYMPSLRIRGLK